MRIDLAFVPYRMELRPARDETETRTGRRPDLYGTEMKVFRFANRARSYVCNGQRNKKCANKFGILLAYSYLCR